MRAKEGHRYYSERTRLEEVIPLDTPFILYVDPSSACNLKCDFCPCGGAHQELWSDEKKKSIGIMEFEIFKKLIDDCKGFNKKIKVLRLYKEGEPLINPRFVDMVAYAKKSGCFDKIDTTTNGLLFNPTLNRKIVSAGIDRINISIEGLSAEDYFKVCGKRIDYNELIENIKDLYENKGDCHIFIKTVTAEKDSVKSRELKNKFYELFGDICDEIAFEHIAPCWPGFDDESFDGEVGIYGNKVQECKVCPRIFYILTINSDGAATRCIVDWNRRMVFGNVKNDSVVELWKKMDDFRIEHLKGNRRKQIGCSECLEIETAALDNIDDYSEELLKKILSNGVNNDI